jgi:hypothetical protein
VGDTLSCPSCDADIDIGSFPVFEGTLRKCMPCNLTLVVGVHEGPEVEAGGHASLTEQGCDDCDLPPWHDPKCERCGGTGYEPAQVGRRSILPS